jgi:hypothetical protein
LPRLALLPVPPLFRPVKKLGASADANQPSKVT